VWGWIKEPVKGIANNYFPGAGGAIDTGEKILGSLFKGNGG
jgi:hypothetical protein